MKNNMSITNNYPQGVDDYNLGLEEQPIYICCKCNEELNQETGECFICNNN